MSGAFVKHMSSECQAHCSRLPTTPAERPQSDHQQQGVHSQAWYHGANPTPRAVRNWWGIPEGKLVRGQDRQQEGASWLLGGTADLPSPGSAKAILLRLGGGGEEIPFQAAPLQPGQPGASGTSVKRSSEQDPRAESNFEALVKRRLPATKKIILPSSEVPAIKGLDT